MPLQIITDFSVIAVIRFIVQIYQVKVKQEHEKMKVRLHTSITALTKSIFSHNWGSSWIKISTCNSSNFRICPIMVEKSLSSLSKYPSFSSTRMYKKKEPCKHMMSFQRGYDVVRCCTTSYRRWNNVVCL